MPAAGSIWRWRDWMIQALNDDLPYDQFVRAQILGNRHGGRPTLTVFGTRARAEAMPQDQFALGFLSAPRSPATTAIRTSPSKPSKPSRRPSWA
jgi:hypothetical protein